MLYSCHSYTLRIGVYILVVVVGADHSCSEQPPTANDKEIEDASSRLEGGVAVESTTNSIGMKLVLIPPGEFTMGNSLQPSEEVALVKKYGINYPESAYRQEYPSHGVRISKPFYLGAYPVTRGEFQRFIEDTGYKTDAERDKEPGAIGIDLEEGVLWKFHKNASWRRVSFPQTARHPVVNVSWNDAKAFCKWLSEKERQKVRLPTEAEWEYACRAGTTTRYWFGNDPEALAKVGNTADARMQSRFPNDGAARIQADDGYVFTSPVGRFLPNPFGLYDVHGNVWEWCQDAYREYKVDDPTPLVDPQGDLDSRRVQRGGSWNFGIDESRSAQRMILSPSGRNDSIGFRIVQEVERESESPEAINDER